MGRFVKNTSLYAGSYAIRVPVGSNIISPQFPVDGQIRYNKTDSPIITHSFEAYYDGAWHRLATDGRVPVIKDSWVGDGSTLIFTFSTSNPINTNNPNGPSFYEAIPGVNRDAEVFVFVGNIFQNPSVSYSLIDSTIVFNTEPPADGQSIIVLHNLNSTHVR